MSDFVLIPNKIQKISKQCRFEEALAYAYEIKGQGHKYILLENDLPDNY